MLNLSLKELELEAKNRGIKGYKSMSIDKLLSILHVSEPIKTSKTIRDIRKENFDADKILEDIENLFNPKNKAIKDIKRENCEADKILRDMDILFNPDKKDYYKPIRNVNAFSGNYIEYESNEDEDKTLSIEEYLDEIKPYLNDSIDDFNTRVEWKIKLAMVIKFFCKNSNEARTMHTKIDSIKIMIGKETDETTKESFDLLLQRYQEKLEQSTRRSELVFDSVDILYCKRHKISLNGGGS